MKYIIDKLLYDTETATLLASNYYWDGSNHERHGRNTYLYKTPNGRYFVHYTTMWEGERDGIRVVSKDEAIQQYEDLPECAASYKEAFGEEPEPA